MTRIAMIGSSHTGALRMAWDALPESERSAEVDFFVAPAGIYGTLSLEGNLFGLHGKAAAREQAREMVEKLNDGALTIDLSDYDHVILVGHAFNTADLLMMLAETDIDTLRDTGADQLMSRQAFESLVGAQVMDNLPVPCWQNLADIDVTVVIRPRLSEDSILAAPRRAGLKRDPAGLGEVLDWCTNRARSALDPLGIRLVDQPRETLADNGLTRAAYSRGSARLNARAHGDEDHAHMNADYGALQWREILETLGLQK